MEIEASVRLAVDLVVLTVRGGQLHTLLVERGVEPFQGSMALPGGFVLEGEPLESAAERELVEETGVAGLRHHLEQLGTYGDPERDPRGRVISVAYLAFVPSLREPVAGSDAAEAAWVPFTDAPADLAFDHERILGDGIERARAKLEYTSLATRFCPDEFTINELREIYCAVWGVDLDPRNFHRKVTSAEGFVEAIGTTTNRGGGRPAKLFRVGDEPLLHPPLLRGE